MRSRRIALVIAIAAMAMVPSVAATAQEDCTGTPVNLCVIQGQQQAYFLFSPAGGGNGELTVDSTGGALISFFTQDPPAQVRGVAPRGALTISAAWGADHAGDPAATAMTVTGTIPLQANDLGLASIDVDLELVGVAGDSSHRGSGCSVADTGSAGVGRSRLAAATGTIGAEGAAGSADLAQAASQIRRYDVCLTAKS